MSLYLHLLRTTHTHTHYIYLEDIFRYYIQIVHSDFFSRPPPLSCLLFRRYRVLVRQKSLCSGIVTFSDVEYGNYSWANVPGNVSLPNSLSTSEEEEKWTGESLTVAVLDSGNYTLELRAVDVVGLEKSLKFPWAVETAQYPSVESLKHPVGIQAWPMARCPVVPCAAV